MIWIFASAGRASHCAPGPPAAAMSPNEIDGPPKAPSKAPPVRPHGKWMPFDCTQKPTNAAIATRPCLISAWRNQPTVAVSVDG